MAVVVTNKRGKQVTLLNPSEKGSKFACELKTDIRYTNDGLIKTDDRNNYMHLSPEQRAYRAGYLDAQKDSAKCFNAKKGKNRKGKCKNLPAMY